MNTTAEAETHTVDQSRAQPLRRPTSDRMIAGVAAGIADYLGADVTIIRIVLAVLTFVGGAGVPIYLACWLLIPEEGSTSPSPAASSSPGRPGRSEPKEARTMPAPYNPPWGRGSSGQRPTPDPNIRVSHAERTDVADRLSKHYGDGRLDEEEFNERLDRAMKAKTRADLDGLFDDLPDAEGPPRPSAAPLSPPWCGRHAVTARCRGSYSSRSWRSSRSWWDSHSPGRCSPSRSMRHGHWAGRSISPGC